MCGCGVADNDRDGDGSADCEDGCPDNAELTSPGVCQCGVPQAVGNVDACVFTTRLPLQDTYVSSASPQTNFSAERELLVDGDPSLFHALLKPTGLGDVPAGATVVDAQLLLHLFDGGNDLAVHALEGTWSADTVTFSSAPTAAAQLTTLPGALALPVSGPVTVLVQAWVDGEPLDGLGLYPTGPNGIDIRSSEYVMPGERPVIEVRWAQLGGP